MKKPGGYLKRLDAAHYLGRSMVHWSMTIDRRRTGWLDLPIHFKFRELMSHTLSRYRLLCPIYCLMPEHLHLLWMGTGAGSDQLRASSFLRKHFGIALKARGFALQEQAYDHVLREEEREKGAIESLLFYIGENPLRAGLVEDARAWEFSGSLAVGYPDFDWRDKIFEEKLWAINSRECAQADG